MQWLNPSKISISELVRSVLLKSCPANLESVLHLISVLVESGCDYYDLILLLSQVNFNDTELDYLASLAPKEQINLEVSITNIERSLFRWNASSCRSRTRKMIVNEIYVKLRLGESGIFVYNGNENTRKEQNSRELYLLLISHQRRLFLDINRKVTIQFYTKRGDPPC